jgi:hypothetical protein
MSCGTWPSRQELAVMDKNVHGEMGRLLTCGECKPSHARRGDNFALIANIDSLIHSHPFHPPLLKTLCIFTRILAKILT